MEKSKYKVELDRDTVRELMVLLDFGYKNFPFMTEKLGDIHTLLYNIINKGCFVHSIFKKRIRISSNETNIFCPKCNPELEKKYKDVEDY